MSDGVTAVKPISAEGVLRVVVDRLRAERDEARDGAIVYRERAYTAEAEVERLRARLSEVEGPMMQRAEYAERSAATLQAEVERLRAERDEVLRWLRQWRDDGWRPATPGHDWLDEWMEAERGE